MEERGDRMQNINKSLLRALKAASRQQLLLLRFHAQVYLRSRAPEKSECLNILFIFVRL